MDLARANSRFNSVSLQGWDGTDWVPDVSFGNFMSFDRFITERTFGQKKRMFEVGGDYPIDPAYEVVRTVEGTKYVIISANSDYRHDKVYGRTYLMQEVKYTADIIKFIETPSASGMGGETVEVLDSTVFCDVERITSENSREFNNVRYSSHVIILPRSCTADTDDQVSIDGHRYEIMEMNRTLLIREARAIKMGAG